MTNPLPRALFLILALGQVLRLQAQEPLIQNVPNRTTQSLDGAWHYIMDPYETGFYNYRYEPYDKEDPIQGGFALDAKPTSPQDLVEYDFSASPQIQVPGDWNSQENFLQYYEGTIWYQKRFDFQGMAADRRVFLYFGAINYEAHIYLNGVKLGSHVGGFTPFNFEVTSLLKETGNTLVVKVDNKRKPEGVPTINTDWWNYGGITRSVKLVEVPATFIRDYHLSLGGEQRNKVSGYVQLDGAEMKDVVEVGIPELGIRHQVEINGEGRGSFEFTINSFDLWAPETPETYQVQFKFQGGVLQDKVGFRTIETQGKDILLNGQSIFLKGICIHEESPWLQGRVRNEAQARQLLLWAKELGCNYVRLAHYPHNEAMVRAAEELGLLVWAEIPVYWTIHWTNPETYANAEGQLTAMIQRDKNRANVIIWSMANETPRSPERLDFLTRLVKTTKSLDATRLVSAALEVHSKEGKPEVITMDDPFAQVVDVISFNQYIGWYAYDIDHCDQVQWEIPFDKPVLISEFGAGAKQGLHGPDDHRWTEEYQASLYEKTLPMLDRMEQFRGVTPWILVDFRSPKRLLPGVQDGWNRKGVIGSNGLKKQAYYVLQRYYLKDYPLD